MSTDKLQALSNTVAGILNEPPSPPTFFDEEPHNDRSGSGQVAKASDSLEHSADAPKGKFGKLTPREQGPSPDPTVDAPVLRAAENEGFNAGHQPPSKLEVASLRADPQSMGMDTPRPAVSRDGSLLRGWIVRGLAGILLAAGVGAGAVAWMGSSGEAAKTASPPVPAAVPTAPPPELTPLLQSMSRDLANLRKDIEQLKLGREQMAKENANLSEQLKANQEQLTRAVARLSDQLKSSQDLAARDNANTSEQIKTMKDQLIRLEQNAPPKIVVPPPRVGTPPAHKPASTPTSVQTTPQLSAAKPKPPTTATVRPPTMPAR